METESKTDGKRGGKRRLVIAVLVALAVISLTVVTRRFDVAAYWRERIQTEQQHGHSREFAVLGYIEQYKTMLMMYEGMNGFYPTTEQGLKALITKPESEPKPRSWRQLLDKPILDPWQQDYFYEQPGRHNPKDYDLFSAGPDRTPHTADDIGNWDAAEK
jgi:general secretion pathway protein G